MGLRTLPIEDSSEEHSGMGLRLVSHNPLCYGRLFFDDRTILKGSNPQTSFAQAR